MKNLFHKVSAQNPAKFLFQNKTSGGRIENLKESINRTSIELASLKNEVDIQNTIRNQVKKDLDKLSSENLLETKITVTKRDTLGALAFGMDKAATRKYKQKNHLIGKLSSEQHSQKDININWNTSVEYSNGKVVPLNKANDIFPGDIVTFKNDAAGNTVIQVFTSNRVSVSNKRTVNIKQDKRNSVTTTTTNNDKRTDNFKENITVVAEDNSGKKTHGTNNQSSIYVEKEENITKPKKTVKKKKIETVKTAGETVIEPQAEVISNDNNSEDLEWDKSDLFYEKFITNDPSEIPNLKENNKKIAKNTETALPSIEDNADNLARLAATKSAARNAVLDSVRENKPYKDMDNDNERWEYLNKKRTELINAKGLQDYEQVSKNSEAANDILTATRAIKKLYKLRNTRDDVTRDDVKNKETDFMKKYMAAKSAYDKVETKSKVPNAKLFEDIRHGKLRMELVVATEKLMKELPDVKNPSESDFENVEQIIDNINAARKHGPVNDLFEEREPNDPSDDSENLTKFLVKARRTNHMKVKKDTQDTYSKLTEKYPSPKEVTEKDINNKDFTSLVDELAENVSSYKLNKSRDPEKNDPNKTWEGKYLDQSSADKIEAYVLRIEQLRMSRDFVQNFKLLPKVLFKNKADKNNPGENAARRFFKLDQKLNLMAEKYQVAGAKVLQSDLERMGGKDIIGNIEKARASVDMWYDSYLSEYGAERKVEIKDGGKKVKNISFKEVE